VAGRIRTTEKSNDLIGNRTRDLPACSNGASTNYFTGCPPKQAKKGVIYQYYYERLLNIICGAVCFNMELKTIE
jgi:hypothetical protein